MNCFADSIAVLSSEQSSRIADQPAGKTRQNWSQGRAPWTLRHIPDGRGRGAEGIIPGDSAADRGTTATATTSACVRRPVVMRSRATEGGVRPNASENGQISPSTTIRAARGGGSCSELRFCLAGSQENREYPSQFGSHLGNPGQEGDVMERRHFLKVSFGFAAGD